MQRNRIGFWLLALGAAVLAACSTSGSRGSIVPQVFRAESRHHRHPVRAVVYLRIPPRHHRHRRMRPQYVSPGTASISFAVQPIAASGPQPTPMPLQTMNVVTPAPCATISPTNAALQCQFTVSVMPGRDSFVVTTYTGLNASGKVLSQYTSGSTIIPTPDPSGNLVPLGFTLEGAIDHVVLQYPNSVVPADTKGQAGAIPVGVATTVPLNVTPYDAANYQILSQVPATGTPVPYAAPVTLSISPTGKGFTLSNASGSGNSVKISGPLDLDVSVDYSGAFTASGGSISSTTSFSIAATGTTLAARPRKKIDLRASRAATPAPNAASIVLSGNAIPVATIPSTLTSPLPISLVNDGAAGNMAYFVSGLAAGNVVNALLGTVNAGVPSSPSTFVGNIANANFADHLGNLWVYDHVADQIDCFAAGNFTTPAGSIPTASLFPVGGGLQQFNGFAEDSSNNLWFALFGTVGGFYFYTIGDVPINSTSCSAPAASISQTQPADVVYLFDLAAIPGTGSVAVGSYDYTTGNGSVIVGTTAVATPNVSTNAPLGFGVSPGAMFGPAGTAYSLLTSPNGSLGSVAASGAYTNVTSYDTVIAPFIQSTTAKGASASGVLGVTADNSAYSDGEAVLLFNPTDTNAASNVEVLPVASLCQGIAFDAQDTAWTLCLNAQNVPQLYHIVPTPTWSVLPGTVVPVTLHGGFGLPYTGSVYLGILEALGTTTSGPFTLTNYDTNVISNVGSEGDRGITFDMSEPNPGAAVATADVVDSTGRTVPVTLEVNAIYNAGAPPRHGARANARRGYPPPPRN